METYTETVLRYRIFAQRIETPERRQRLIEEGYADMLDQWSLKWSFETKEAAEAQMAREEEEMGKWERFKIVDNGEATQHQRSILF